MLGFRCRQREVSEFQVICDGTELLLFLPSHCVCIYRLCYRCRLCFEIMIVKYLVTVLSFAKQFCLEISISSSCFFECLREFCVKAWSHERVNRASNLCELIATCDHLLATKNHLREWKCTRTSRVEHVQLHSRE